MTDNENSQILVAIARLDEKVTNLVGADTRANEQLAEHRIRLDKLERLAYTALGIALASGVSGIAGLFH